MSEGLSINGGVITIGRNDLEQIVRAAVREELHAVGLRADEPEQVDEARADFRFVRRMRKGVEGIANKVGMTVVVALVGGLLTVLSWGLRSALRS